MFTTATLIATALLALCIGLAVGWAMGLRRKSKRDVIIDLETRLERALESRADYEAEVAEHFARTAELLNRMTEDYQQVYSHLASGADKLCEGSVDIPTSASLLADSSTHRNHSIEQYLSRTCFPGCSLPHCQRCHALLEPRPKAEAQSWNTI